MTAQTGKAHEISDRGAEIYARRYKLEFEGKWLGRFVAIDVANEQAFVADFPDEALALAREASPTGLFYVTRIGSQGAYKSSRLTHAGDRVV